LVPASPEVELPLSESPELALPKSLSSESEMEPGPGRVHSSTYA
jgi:hypothetical protein